jgi:hypothetical protein
MVLYDDSKPVTAATCNLAGEKMPDTTLSEGNAIKLSAWPTNFGTFTSITNGRFGCG